MISVEILERVHAATGVSRHERRAVFCVGTQAVEVYLNEMEKVVSRGKKQ